MEQSLKELIQECNNSAFNIKKQKLDLISKLGEHAHDLLNAMLAINGLEKNSIHEIRAFSNPPKIVNITLEAYRILISKNQSDLQDVQLIEYEHNLKKYMVPYQSDWKKILLMMRNLYEDLKNFDFQSIKNPNSIKILDQLDFSDDSPLSTQYVERCSLLCKNIIIIVKLSYKLAKSQNQQQSQVNYKYQDLMNLIKDINSQQFVNKVINLEQHLNLNQSSSQKNVSEDIYETNTIFDIEIQNILNNLKQKIQILQFCSDFTNFFNFNIDFDVWVSSKRPLAYWYEVDEINERQKIKELIDFIKFSNNNQIQQTCISIGFDFLLLLRKHELKQIQELSFDSYSVLLIKKMIFCLKHLYELNLKKLKPNNKFYEVALLDKDLAKIFSEFLKTQNQIEYFSFNYQSFYNQQPHISVLLKAMKSLNNLKMLRFHFKDHQITQKQFFKIQEAILSFPLLESLDIQLTYSFNQNDENMNEYTLPLTLKKLNLQINITDQLKYGQHIPKLSNLKYLKYLKLRFDIECEEVNTQCFLEVYNDLKNLKLHQLEFKCDHNFPSNFHKNMAQKFYKLKRLVNLNLQPSLKEIFEIYDQQIE